MKKIVLLVAIAFSGFFVSAQNQMKVGYVDMEYIIQKLPQVKTIKSQLETEQKKLVNQLIETAVLSANESEDGALLLANVISNSDLETNGAILNSISNDTNSTLGAEVLSNLADLDETNTIFTDTETVDQLNNFVDTIASTNLINPTSNDQKNVEYDQNGFDVNEPFFNKDTGTAYNLDGFDKYGYNSDGYNKSGFNNATNYNSSYDENVSPS